MNIAYALLGILISVAGMALVGRKWNVGSFSNLWKSAILAFIIAIPFLWVYPLFATTWMRLLIIGVQIVLTFALVFGILFIRFWRDPERTPGETTGVVISPADGEVIYIKEVPHETIPIASKGGKDYRLNELIGNDFNSRNRGVIIIGIDMSITDVHVNRCPIPGEVKLVKHIPGHFLSLRRTEAPFLNTRCTTIISNETLTVATVQISSRLVRKIDNYLKPGQCVQLGQRLGMIKFGSQVAVILPNLEGMKVEVSLGQSTRAGVSTLARY